MRKQLNAQNTISAKYHHDPMNLITLLSSGNFVIGMGAFVVIGIMNPLRDSFAVTSTDAGLVLTLYALAYAVGSPLAVALTGRWSRRTVLLTGASLFTAATLVSALAPTLWVLLLCRMAAALGAGLFTPVCASVAFASSPAGQEGRSLAKVYFGLTLAQVLGVPFGSFLGYTFGWSSAFVLVAALGVLLIIGLLLRIPKDIPFQVNSLSTLAEALADWRSFASVLFTASFLAAIFIPYTYAGPLLQETLGYGRNGVTFVLILFGVGAVAGNFLGGYLSDKVGPYPTLIMLCITQILCMPLLSLLPFHSAMLWLLVLTWSVAGWSFNVAQQSRLVQQTPQRQSIVLSLNAASIYVGTAFGGSVGGAVIQHIGIIWLGVAGGVGAACALLHLVLSEKAANARQATAQ